MIEKNTHREMNLSLPTVTHKYKKKKKKEAFCVNNDTDNKNQFQMSLHADIVLVMFTDDTKSDKHVLGVFFILNDK